MTFHGTLHPYQVEDVQVMKDLKKVLVAYGQGTGKTVMTIAAIEDLMDDMRIVEPGLVVCLSSLKYQWAAAIAQFTCSVCNGTMSFAECEHTATSTSLVIDGTKPQRDVQYAQARAWDADYVILSYEQVVNDWEQVKSLARGFMVCDEASFIKGFKAKRSRFVKKMDAEYKYALTGTPIENGKPEELFSILEWVNPTVMGRFDLFDRTFIVRNDSGWVERYRNIPTFLERLRTCMVRRTPADPEVAPYMPEQDLRPPLLVPLDRASRKVYNYIADLLLADLDEAAASFGTAFSLDTHYGWGQSSDQADAMRGKIGSKMLALQMLCDHPMLLRRSADLFDSDADGGSKFAAELYGTGVVDNNLTACPKMSATMRHILDLLDADPRNKVVLFTTYVGMVEIFMAALGDKARPFTGKQTAKQKEANKIAFQTDPTIRVLVSSDAGGYGVDLPQANYLINYDQPDRAGAADQRDTRIVRASSEFDVVTISSVLIRGSLEERKYASLAQKRAVAAAFIDGRQINQRGGVDLDLDTLTRFLRTSSV